MSAEPWGRYAPNRLERWLIALCRRMPRNWLGGRLAILLRRPIKYGADTPLDVTVWGLKLRLHRRGNYSETALIVTPQFFDPVERATLERRLRAGAVFLDLGANAGAYTFWVYSVLLGRCRIVAVEADPELHAALAFNVATNAASAIAAVNAALDERCGTRTLYVNPARRGQTSLLGLPGAPPGVRAVTVETKTLAQVVAEQGIERIDAMKVDIEGMEYTVLRHFFDTAARALRPRLLLLEDKGTPEHVALRELLSGLGYRPIHHTWLNVILELSDHPET